MQRSPFRSVICIRKWATAEIAWSHSRPKSDVTSDYEAERLCLVLPHRSFRTCQWLKSCGNFESTVTRANVLHFIFRTFSQTYIKRLMQSLTRHRYQSPVFFAFWNCSKWSIKWPILKATWLSILAPTGESTSLVRLTAERPILLAVHAVLHVMLSQPNHQQTEVMEINSPAISQLRRQ